MMTAQQLVFTELDFCRLGELVRSGRYLTTHSDAVSRLKPKLDRGVVIRGNEVPPDVVTMRSRVRVVDQRTRETGTYTLSYPDDADINRGRLSVLAPLGTAMLGAREGQTLDVGGGTAACRLRVKRVLYQPEAAGRFDL